MKRKEILDEAARIVAGERQEMYGKAEDSFALIGGLWTAYLGFTITPIDVALMMILLKVAREKGGKGKADNWIDISGYAACGGEIATEQPTDNKTPTTDDIRKIAEENEHQRELLRAIFGDTSGAGEEPGFDSIGDVIRELRKVSEDLHSIADDLEEGGA